MTRFWFDSHYRNRTGCLSFESQSDHFDLSQRRRKRFCDKRRPSCTLCVSRGLPCVYLTDGTPDPAAMDAIIAKGGKRYACEGCKAGKKACDGIYPCGRCSARGIECVFLGKAKERLQFSAVNAGQGGDAKSPAQASRSTGSPLSPTSSGKRKRAESEPAVDDALSRALSRPRLFQTSGPLPSPWNPTNLVQVAAADRGHQAMDPRYLLPGHSAPAWQHGYPTHPYNPPNPSHAPQITNLLNHPYQSPHPHSQPDSSHSPATAPSPSEDQLLELWHPSPAAPPSPGKPTISSLLWSPDPPQPHSPYSESGRQPGSWYPPVPTPPFVVSRPVPRADGMPGEEVLRGLAWEFFEDYRELRQREVWKMANFCRHARNRPHLPDPAPRDVFLHAPVSAPPPFPHSSFLGLFNLARRIPRSKPNSGVALFALHAGTAILG